MKHPLCAVEVGVHPGPFWLANGTRIFCDRHRWQYEERDDLTPMTWQLLGTASEAWAVAEKANSE